MSYHLSHYTPELNGSEFVLKWKAKARQMLKSKQVFINASWLHSLIKFKDIKVTFQAVA